jgi:hypothetical protein
VDEGGTDWQSWIADETLDRGLGISVVRNRNAHAMTDSCGTAKIRSAKIRRAKDLSAEGKRCERRFNDGPTAGRADGEASSSKEVAVDDF